MEGVLIKSFDKEKMKGTVKFFNKDKGFGFISSEEGDHYFHKTDILNNEELSKGDIVEFNSEGGKNGLRARKVKI